MGDLLWRKGKVSAYRAGYERKLTVNDFIVSLLYDRNLWKSDISVETPFWVGISNKDWQQPEDFRKKFLQIPKHKQDDTVWNTCYFALEPLADATLEEVDKKSSGSPCWVNRLFVLSYIVAPTRRSA